MVKFNIKGLVVPVFTPVNVDGTINFSLIPDYVTYLANEKITGILVAGTSGEATCFNVAERKELAEAFVKSAKQHNIQVIVQVGGAPLPDVLELAKHAEQIKADAILTLPELYFKPKTAEELAVYVKMVSYAAPSLPILYYHFPMMSGVNVDIKEFFALACEKVPNFRGMKADLGVAVQVAEHIQDDIRVFMGNHIVAPAALLGYDNSIATITNLFPSLVRDTIESVKKSDNERTRVLQTQLNKIVSAISSEGDWVSTMKVAMELVTGIKVGPPRAPLVPLTHEKKVNIQQKLEKLSVKMAMTIPK